MRPLALGAALFIWLSGAGLAAGQTAGQPSRVDTVTFADAAEALPPCCAVPVETVVRAAVMGLPGVLRVDEDEATGHWTISFDSRRVSRAELIAALEEAGFRPIDETRGPDRK
jgi:copper chaperone CopZ